MPQSPSGQRALNCPYIVTHQGDIIDIKKCDDSCPSEGGGINRSGLQQQLLIPADQNFLHVRNICGQHGDVKPVTSIDEPVLYNAAKSQEDGGYQNHCQNNLRQRQQDDT